MTILILTPMWAGEDSPGWGSCGRKLGEEHGADQREARVSRHCGFRKRPFPCLREAFGTARSGQGRAASARRSEPLTARTVLEDRAEGKGRGGLRGFPPGGAPGQRPAHLTARVSARHP